jgi:LysM repeat protein
MRVRLILLISIVLNVALVAAFLLFAPSRKPQTPIVRPVNIALVNSNVVPILKTNVLIRPRWFSWNEVESEDYAQYVQNLRGIGMPESTIRDVIIADVDQLFIRKRREQAAQQDTEWWRAQPSAAYQSNQLAQAYALDEERSALLTRLLGENWRKSRLDQQAEPVALTGPVLSMLSDEAKLQVQDVAAQSNERMKAYLTQMQAAGQQPSEQELARLREQTREELAKILNPQQLEEFLLRYSLNANQLRQRLSGLDVTPDEFRAIFRKVDQIDRDLQLRFSGNDADSQQQRAALEQQRQAIIRDAVGAERYDTLVMLRDPAYQQMATDAQRAGAPPEAATALYEIQRATSDEIDRIRADATLTAGQKQEQMRETLLEQERARALVLGEPLPEETTVAAPQLRSHVKVPGETLGQIALRYGMTIPAIREVNPGVDINRAPAGTVLNIPIPTPPLPPGAGVR